MLFGSSHTRTQVITLVLVICTSGIHLYLLTRPPFRLDFERALRTPQGVGSAVAFSISILILWPVLALLLYHLRVGLPSPDFFIFYFIETFLLLLLIILIFFFPQLLLLNVTTIEQVGRLSFPGRSISHTHGVLTDSQRRTQVAGGGASATQSVHAWFVAA